jgi:hypothetical protein
MNEKMTEKGLLARLEALPREIAPDRDVWPAIANRIEKEPAVSPEPVSSNRWWYPAVAASFALLIAAGILLERQETRVPVPVQADMASEVQGEFVRTGGLSGTLFATELEYQAAFREFISVSEPTGNLKHQTVEKMIAGWKDLRESEVGLNLALQQNPGNPFLNEKMLKLRSRQLEFLKQIATLDRNSRRTMI